MTIAPELLEILACPDTHHAPLAYDEPAQTLTCTDCGRVFEIRDGIPVLLLDEARTAPGKVRPAPESDEAPTAPESDEARTAPESDEARTAPEEDER